MPIDDRPSRVLTRGHYAWLALGFFVFVIYGSLVPFHYQPMPVEQALAQFHNIPYLNLGVGGRADWVANILLLIPLSFLIMGAIGADRSWVVVVVGALVTMAFAVALAVAVEFIQLFFPPRTVSLNDIVAESIGGVVGTGLWLAWGQRITRWARQLWSQSRSHGLAAQILPGYLVILVIIHVMPMDLTISLSEIYHKYRGGMVWPVPFTHRASTLYEAVSKTLWNSAYFLPLGILCALLPEHGRWTPKRWPSMLRIALVVTATIEFMQLFVCSRYCDTTDIVTGSGAALLGWWGTRTFRARWGVGLRADHSHLLPRWVWAAAFVSWVTGLTVANWRPFNFTGDFQSAVDRYRSMSLVPFQDYYFQSEYNSFDQFLMKSLTFMPVGILLAFRLPHRHKAARLLAALVGLVLAVIFEGGQFFLPSRFPSVTDVLIETMATWIGFRLAGRALDVLSATAKEGTSRRSASARESVRTPLRT